KDALISADDGAFLWRGGAIQRIWQGTAGPVTALDSSRALIVDAGTQSVIEVNWDTGESLTTDCPCSPTSLTRMRGGVFRLNEVSGAALWLVEVLDSGLRTVFVPPDASDPVTEE